MDKLLIGLGGLVVGYGVAYVIASQRGLGAAVNPFVPAPLVGMVPLLPPPVAPPAPIGGMAGAVKATPIRVPA